MALTLNGPSAMKSGGSFVEPFNLRDVHPYGLRQTNYVVFRRSWLKDYIVNLKAQQKRIQNESSLERVIRWNSPENTNIGSWLFDAVRHVIASFGDHERKINIKTPEGTWKCNVRCKILLEEVVDKTVSGSERKPNFKDREWRKQQFHIHVYTACFHLTGHATKH